MPLYRDGTKLWTIVELAEELGLTSSALRRKAIRLGVRRFKTRVNASSGQKMLVVNGSGAAILRQANQDIEVVE